MVFRRCACSRPKTTKRVALPTTPQRSQLRPPSIYAMPGETPGAAGVSDPRQMSVSRHSSLWRHRKRCFREPPRLETSPDLTCVPRVRTPTGVPKSRSQTLVTQVWSSVKRPGPSFGRDRRNEGLLVREARDAKIFSAPPRRDTSPDSTCAPRVRTPASVPERCFPTLLTRGFRNFKTFQKMFHFFVAR